MKYEQKQKIFTDRENQIFILETEKNEALSKLEKMKTENESLRDLIEKEQLENLQQKKQIKELQEKEGMSWNFQNLEQNCIPESLIPESIKCSSCSQISIGSKIRKNQDLSSNSR